METEKRSEKNASEAEEKLKELDFDEFLSCAGEFGLYQWLLSLSTFPFYIFGAFTYFGQMFMTQASTNHWCWIPELENLTAEERRSLAIPLDKNDLQGYSHCSAYVANWTEVLTTGLKPNASWPVAACMNGWEFNKTEIPYPTISSEMGWVCEQSSNQATAQSVFFVGCIVGGLLIGWISDRFGRLVAVTCANMFPCIAGICSVYTTNFVQFAICRFFVGMGYDNCMMMVYLFVLEYVGPKYRTLIANLPIAIFYTLGLTSLPWISLACGHWKVIGLVTSVPLALALLTRFVMPESPRWLISKGRVEDTINIVLSIGKVNKKSVPQSTIDAFRLSAAKNSENSTGTILQMLKRSALRKMFICSCLVYMSLMIILDVAMRSVGQLNFDFFLSFTLVSLTQLPSALVVIFVMEFIGRKWLTILVTILCIPVWLVRAFVLEGVVSVVCAILLGFMLNLATSATAQWGAEVLPTIVRGSGFAIIHICVYLATVISPFVVYLGEFAYYLPFVVSACISILAVLLAFNVPETTRVELPQTFEDAEMLIRTQPFWDFPLRKKKV